ncbi:hypothetical protein ACFQY5_35395 [Paeniroseomonas aquatica]|uniref:hypothetical protein n=1 Tax=Paeniroseomonas aquatica TaxID=373043 RepID=UPI00360B37A8
MLSPTKTGSAASEAPPVWSPAAWRKPSQAASARAGQRPGSLGLTQRAMVWPVPRWSVLALRHHLHVAEGQADQFRAP